MTRLVKKYRRLLDSFDGGLIFRFSHSSPNPTCKTSWCDAFQVKVHEVVKIFHRVDVWCTVMVIVSSKYFIYLLRRYVGMYNFWSYFRGRDLKGHWQVGKPSNNHMKASEPIFHSIDPLSPWFPYYFEISATVTFNIATRQIVEYFKMPLRVLTAQSSISDTRSKSLFILNHQQSRTYVDWWSFH